MFVVTRKVYIKISLRSFNYIILVDIDISNCTRSWRRNIKVSTNFSVSKNEWSHLIRTEERLSNCFKQSSTWLLAGVMSDLTYFRTYLMLNNSSVRNWEIIPNDTKGQAPYTEAWTARYRVTECSVCWSCYLLIEIYKSLSWNIISSSWARHGVVSICYQAKYASW